MRRMFVWVLLAGAAWGGRFPSPMDIADYVGGAQEILVGKVMKVLPGGGAVVAVEERIAGGGKAKEVVVKIRTPGPSETGATAPRLETGRRFVVFLEQDGMARDYGSLQEVLADGTVKRNGILFEDDKPWTLANVKARIKELRSSAYRKQLLKDLRSGSRNKREMAIRRIAQLRMKFAAPELLVIAEARGDTLSRTALIWVGMLDHPRVVPALMKALENGNSDAVWGFQRLEGESKERATPLLIDRLAAPDTRGLAAQALRYLTGRQLGEDQAAWRKWWREKGLEKPG